MSENRIQPSVGSTGTSQSADKLEIGKQVPVQVTDSDRPSAKGSGEAAEASGDVVARDLGDEDEAELRRSIQGPMEVKQQWLAEAEKVFSTNAGLNNIISALFGAGRLRAGASTAVSIFQTLEQNTAGKPKLQWPKALTTDDYVLWIMGTATRNRHSWVLAPGAIFEGATKLQKLCYFTREYLAPNNVRFSFDAHPYGVYSREIRTALEKLETKGAVPAKTKIRETGDEFSPKQHSVPIKKAGVKRYEEIVGSLAQHNSPEVIQAAAKMIELLYDKEAMDLGWASKIHFTLSYWTPFIHFDAMVFYRYLFEGAEPAEVPALRHFLKKLEKYRSYSQLHLSSYDLPSDTEAVLARAAGNESYHWSRVFLLVSSNVPTNYFVPVDAIQANPFLMGLFTTQVARVIDEAIRSSLHDGYRGPDCRFDCVAVAQAGLAAGVARQLATEGPWTSLPIAVGPYWQRGDRDQSVQDYESCRGKRTVVLTDTLMTGETAAEFATRLANESGATVVAVIVLADRGIGGLSKVKATGFRTRVVYTREAVIDSYRRQKSAWPDWGV